MNQRAPGFYGTYASHKGYATPQLGHKQMARFDAEIWEPAQCSPSHSFLEIGCGTGAFLGYLRKKGVTRLLGIDHDSALASVIPDTARHDFVCRDVWEVASDESLGRFDRIVLLDVLEHFEASDALRLLQSLRGRLAEGGRVVIKVPNAGSPWGLPYQYGDLTHRTAFAPISVRQLADAAGFAPPLLYGQRQGSARRRITDALVGRFLSWALLNPPEIWAANLYAVLQVKP
ncbi:Methyltransferase type 12 [Paramagnetospirillum magnetotacticum MS-1]|uniref:Methyltransferase type 12 n=1 Tax=Paramagnetospirillum magnetotacticum MS-1 TaxID=272627 RepID=A0A0C2YJH9_PARME|nr:class I SAM-dependent methyltransferase [Paramagnetospirillum magnetotacticum]KIL99934.1 Methyltransferase type 12 [Paramagnetospirillum magnetotacticum MS-1]